MFSRNTVLILGAGASLAYGYPTGIKLISDIYNHFYSDNQLFALGGTCSLYDQRFQPHSFKERLTSFHPSSIDKFLKDHPDLSEEGKIAIAYVMLSCESRGSFKHSYDYSHTASPGWYRNLYEALTSSLEEPKNILSNKLKIITFNYDISLEVFLLKTLSEATWFQKDGKNYGREYWDELVNKNIIHVYGRLHENYECYGRLALDNRTRLQKACKLGANIKVVGEDKQKEGKQTSDIMQAKEWLLEADKIVILGFGFDTQNCDLLFNLDGKAPGNIFARKSLNDLPTSITLKGSPVNVKKLDELCYINYADGNSGPSKIIERRMENYFSWKAISQKPKIFFSEKSVNEALNKDFILT